MRRDRRRHLGPAGGLGRRRAQPGPRARGRDRPRPRRVRVEPGARRGVRRGTRSCRAGRSGATRCGRSRASPGRHATTRARSVSSCSPRSTGPRGPIQVYCAHLSWRDDHSAIRQAQVAEICHLVREHRPRSFPAVLCGDLNADPTSDELRMLTGQSAVPVPGVMFRDAWLAAGNRTPGATASNANPFNAAALDRDRRIDFMLVGTAQTRRRRARVPVPGVMFRGRRGWRRATRLRARPPPTRTPSTRRRSIAIGASTSSSWGRPTEAWDTPSTPDRG